MKKSTKALLEWNGGWMHPIKFIHAYIYLAKTSLYIGTLMPIFNFLAAHAPKPVGRFFLDFMVPNYHGKTVTITDAKKFFSIEKDLRVDDDACKGIMPFETARQIIINNPDQIVTAECPCRMRTKKETGTCCSSSKYGISTCMGVGEPVVSFNFEHSNLNPKKLTVEEALDYLDDFHKNGFVQNIYYKNVMGNSAYAICNCCKCCCGAMKVNNLWAPALGYDKKMIIPSGYVAKTDLSKCKGCYVCAKFCQFEARRMNPVTGKADLIYDKCYGCSVCVDKCPNGAITLVKDPNRGGEPLDVELLQKDHNLLNKRGGTIVA